MPACCVGLGDGGQRGCLAGTGNRAHQRHRRGIGEDAAHEFALLLAEQEAAPGLDAHDALVRVGLGGHELAWRRALRELCDALLCDEEIPGREPPSVQRGDLLEREERVGCRKQRGGIGNRAERERKLTHDIAAGERGVALGETALAEQLLKGAAESARVKTAGAWWPRASSAATW